MPRLAGTAPSMRARKFVPRRQLPVTRSVRSAHVSNAQDTSGVVGIEVAVVEDVVGSAVASQHQFR